MVCPWSSMHWPRPPRVGTDGRAPGPVRSGLEGTLYGPDPLVTSAGTARGGAPGLRGHQLVWGWPALLSPLSAVILGESPIRGGALWVPVGVGGPEHDRAQRLRDDPAPVSRGSGAGGVFTAAAGGLLSVPQPGAAPRGVSPKPRVSQWPCARGHRPGPVSRHAHRLQGLALCARERDRKSVV